MTNLIEGRTGGKQVVFFVDDDEDLLRSEEAVLESAGYLVLGARNGEEALARMRGISGSCVAVIDLLMPVMDGWQLIRAMKADPGLAPIHIITCSGRSMDPVEATQAHLRKPLNHAQLLATIRSCLAGTAAPS